MNEAAPSAIQAVIDYLDIKYPAARVTNPGDIDTESARLELMRRAGQREVVDDLIANLRNRKDA